MEPIDAFIDELPKAELHVHLVGSASLSTVLALARRHPAGQVPLREPELALFYEFRDFPHFAEVYHAVSGLLQAPADVAELVLGAARDLAGQNVRYVELTVTPYTFTAAACRRPSSPRRWTSRLGPRGVSTAFAGLHLRHRRRARRSGRVRHLGARAFLAAGGADRVRAWPASSRPGPRAGTCSARCSPPRPRPAAQRPARGRDVRPRDDLGGPHRPAGRADRARHRCLDDPRLVVELRDRQVPLEVARRPTSAPGRYLTSPRTRCPGCSRRACS